MGGDSRQRSRRLVRPNIFSTTPVYGHEQYRSLRLPHLQTDKKMYLDYVTARAGINPGGLSTELHMVARMGQFQPGSD